MFKLVIADDEGKQTVVPVVRDEISIGRKEGNTIRLTERNVSRHHGKLVKVNGTLYFEEVSARYGTLWNGEKVRGRTEVKFGDVLTVGDYKLFLANQDGSIPESVKRQLEPEEAAPPAEQQRDATEVLTLQPRPASPTMGEPGKLCILNTDYAGQEYALLADKMVVGRTPDNDLVIDHKSISRNHARIERIEGGVYRVIDMGSANGISINGEPRQSAELRRGDVLELGNVKLRFIAPGEMWSYAPGAAAGAVAIDAAAEGGGGMGKLIAIAAVVLLLVGGGLAVVIGGGGGDGEGTQGQGAVAATGGSEQGGGETPVADTADEVSTAQPAPSVEEHQLALDTAQLLWEEKRWEDVIAALNEVPSTSPLFAEADGMKVRARAEMRHRDTWDAAISAESGGDRQEALSAYASIPEDSAYHAEASAARQRIKEAVITEAIDASQAAVGGDDFDDARTALEPALALFPNEERLTGQMAAIDEAEAEAEAAAEAAAEDRRRRQEQRDEEDDEEEDDEEDVPVVVLRPPDDDDEEEDEEEPPSDELSPSERRARANELIRDARREGIRRNHERAIELLEEAQVLNPGESRIYLMLYTNYSRTGDDRRAARSLREYLRREPNDGNAPEYRQIIEELEGN